MRKELMRVLHRFENVKQIGSGYIASCSAHPDANPSLSIRTATDGKVLIHCFTGCKTSDVVRAVGLELRHLFPDNVPN